MGAANSLSVSQIVTDSTATSKISHLVDAKLHKILIPIPQGPHIVWNIRIKDQGFAFVKLVMGSYILPGTLSGKEWTLNTHIPMFQLKQEACHIWVQPSKIQPSTIDVSWNVSTVPPLVIKKSCSRLLISNNVTYGQDVVC